jgi:hypothetical protein
MKTVCKFIRLKQQLNKKMKILISILGILNGGYMLVDGIYVVSTGKYIGPERPGPWACLFETLDINVFTLGPLFIAFGILWLAWLYALWSNKHWARRFGIFISILTLWYLPVGTVFSIIILLVLLLAKKRTTFGK